ncbi:MAG: Bax inhibitor-1 family protein [Candidatus Eremiobacteraeota bacterium]|nr:Bax inhibitor-1 family protein [Candidatus Eremiobacteraeota bacterium]
MAYRVQPSSYGGAAAVAPTRTTLGQVLGITALGLCVSALAVYVFRDNVGRTAGLIAMLVGLGLLFAINGTRANSALSLALFYAFTFAEGIGLTPVISYYLHVAPDVVFNAALTTGLGMFALGAIVYGTGVDLRRFQGILTIALLGLIVVSVAALFFRFVAPTTLSWITLVIFAGFTLIDFARIRAGGDYFTPVQLAVQIYLDVINIFLALLNIFGNRRSSD